MFIKGLTYATLTVAVPRILLADDQPDVLLALQLLLKAEGFATCSVDNPEGVIRAVSMEEYDLLLMDLNYTRDTTSGEEGLDLLSRLRGLPTAPPVVVMTAWGSLETAVEAMRRGARDFVLKPWDNAKLLDTVRTHLAAAPPPLEFDLQIARQVQSRLLPSMPRQGRTIQLNGYCRPIGAVGGDYFDVFDLAPHHIGFVLADISGKGVAAALLMAHLQASLRSLSWQAGQNLPVYLRTINLQFRESTRPEHFATLFFGDYDDSSRRLRYANCGHNPPFLFRADGQIQQLQATATVIGLLEDFRPEVAEISLTAGDRLAIYSDGISDAVSESELPRFLRLERPPQETVEAVPNPQDDCTLLVAAIQ
jgi:phosphoserine phosphatase RsbU/P